MFEFDIAYIEGRNAAYDKKGYSDNPYDKDSQYVKWVAWNDGYQAASHTMWAND